MGFNFNFKLPFGRRKKEEEFEDGMMDEGRDEEIGMDSSSPFGDIGQSEEHPEDEDHPKGEKIEMDSSNPFEGEIDFEDVKDIRQGRKLKKNVVMGIVAVVVLFSVGMVAKNLMAPKTDLTKQNIQQSQEPVAVPSAADKLATQARGIPSNYADLAKYEKDMKEKQKKAEEAAKKKAEAERRKKLEEEKKRLEKEKLEREKIIAEATANQPRQVQTPRVNVTARNQRQQVVQVAPVGPYVSESEMQAVKSKVSFGMDVGNGPSVVAYSGGGNGRLNLSTTFGIQAGTVIPVTLLNGIVSDGGSSDVVAQVRQDVYDSLTGQHLLIPQGSRVLGALNGVNNRRMAVVFKRVILPDGSNISLPSQRAVDKSGYSGLKDKYDTHNPDFFRGALIGGVMAYLADEVDSWKDRVNKKDSETKESYTTALNDTVKKITDKITDRASSGANAQPTVSIRPGFQFNVFINEDINVYEYMR